MVDKKSDKPASSAGKGAAGKPEAFPTIPPLSCIPKTIPFVNCPPPKTMPGVNCPLPPEDAEKGFPTLTCIETIPGVNCPIPTIPVVDCIPHVEATEGEAAEAAFPTIPFSSCLPATIPGVSCPVPTVPILSCIPHADAGAAGGFPTVVGCIQGGAPFPTIGCAAAAIPPTHLLGCSRRSSTALHSDTI